MSDIPSPLTKLDAMFGVHVHHIGDAALRVRRVMTVEQQKAITAVIQASAETNQIVRDLATRDTSTPEAVESLRKDVENTEEGLRVLLVDAINMMTLDGIPELGTLSITTLSWLFNDVRGVCEGKTDAAVAVTGFPTSGA